MRKYLLLSLVSVLSLSSSKVYAGDEPATTSCEALGYTTPYNDCIRANGMPLVCPFYSLDKKMVLCMKESCRGYSLTDADLDAQASDGKKIRDHIVSTESCTVGYGNDAKTYYRVKECKSGSLYQNGICDVGCLQARYPYNQHPGDLAGEVEMCVDTAGKWYGYYTCNSGWVGGWRDSQNGECKFGTCSIADYPYMSDPNINSFGENVNRGQTLTCKIGSNTYYRYTAVDKDGNQLTSNVCGISNNYTLTRGACRKQCVFDNCTKTVKTQTLSGYTFSYNEWTCTQKTQDCRVGDMVTINNTEIGFIVHLPTDSSDRLRLVYPSRQWNYWATGNRSSRYDLPLPNGYTYDGKYNTKFVLKFMDQNNATITGDKYNFPAFSQMSGYSPCGTVPICAVGEWYFPSMYEALYIYNNRYILYNAVNDGGFISSIMMSSDEGNELYMESVYLSGADSYGNVQVWWNKASGAYYYPMLSFYVR